MAPHKDVLQDMIPPKKHLLRHQPVNAQIGLMDGNTFCTTLSPRLFTINLAIMEHKVFFTELLSLCEADDQTLQKLPCYKSITNLVPLRKSALRALSACHYIPECREKIFTVLFKALNSTNNDLVEASYECMKKFISGFTVDAETVNTLMRNMIASLGDYRVMNLNLITRLSYLAQIFPAPFAGNEKILEQLLQLLKKWLEGAILGFKQMQQGVNKAGGYQQLKVAAAVIKLFQNLPSTSIPMRIIEMLCKLILTTERALQLEPGSVLRDPLMLYLAKLPEMALDFLMFEAQAKDAQCGRFLAYIVSHKTEGAVFRNALRAKVEKLIVLFAIGNGVSNQSQMVQCGILQPNQPPGNLSEDDRAEVQFNAVNLTYILVKDNVDWIVNQHTLINSLRTIWNKDVYHEKHKQGSGVDFTHWREPKVIVKILLEYFKLHKDTEILLLFQLLRALCGRFIADFQFLKDFLEKQVCETFPVEWKRAAFFEFVKMWKTPESNLSQDLKAKILQVNNKIFQTTKIKQFPGNTVVKISLNFGFFSVLNLVNI
jgi:transformation/transcription domain-associated protein